MIPLIDRYTLGARVAPAMVVASPAMFAFSAWFSIAGWPTKLAGGGTTLAVLMFVLSQSVRDAGKAIEGTLWASWDGPPTVRMLRHADSTIKPGLKALIHRRLTDLGVVEHIPTVAEEIADLEAADITYATCSDWLRNKALQLRAKPPFDVVHAENIAYGYRRNLLGIKRVGLVVLAISFVATSVAFYSGDRPIVEMTGILIFGVYLCFGVTAQALTVSANNYSERLLNSVQALPLKKSEKTDRKRNTAEKMAGR